MWLMVTARDLSGLVHRKMISTMRKNKAAERRQAGGWVGSVAILERSGESHFEDGIRAKG